MPYWTKEQEAKLKDMVSQGKSLEELAAHLRRSVDAIVLKAKRLGKEIPEECRAKPRDIKVTETTKTTTMSMELPPLKPAQELISMEEMMKKLLGALELLQNPSSLSSLEIKRCRAVVSTARTYMHMLEKFEQWSHIEQGLINMTAKNHTEQRRKLPAWKNSPN